MTEKLDRITKAMRKARLQKRQVWIIDRLIGIWDAEAKAQLNWNQRVESIPGEHLRPERRCSRGLSVDTL